MLATNAQQENGLIKKVWYPTVVVPNVLRGLTIPTKV
jgi:hypothetical protein